MIKNKMINSQDISSKGLKWVNEHHPSKRKREWIFFNAEETDSHIR